MLGVGLVLGVSRNEDEREARGRVWQEQRGHAASGSHTVAVAVASTVLIPTQPASAHKHHSAKPKNTPKRAPDKTATLLESTHQGGI